MKLKFKIFFEADTEITEFAIENLQDFLYDRDIKDTEIYPADDEKYEIVEFVTEFGYNKIKEFIEELKATINVEFVKVFEITEEEININLLDIYV